MALGYADGGDGGPRIASAIRIERVRKADNQVGFTVTARRRMVVRLFANIHRNRRLAKDFEAIIDSVEAFLYAASSVILPRKFTR